MSTFVIPFREEHPIDREKLLDELPKGLRDIIESRLNHKGSSWHYKNEYYYIDHVVRTYNILMAKIKHAVKHRIILSCNISGTESTASDLYRDWKEWNLGKSDAIDYVHDDLYSKGWRPLCGCCEPGVNFYCDFSKDFD